MKQAQIVWDGAAERFIATGSGGHQVVVNAPHADDPDRRTGISPAELLLVAAGTCSAWDVVEILRKQRQQIEGVEVRVTGDQELEAPWTFREVVLEFVIRGRGISHELADKAVRLSEEKYCSVTSTIRRGASVRSTVTVDESAPGDPTGTTAGAAGAASSEPGDGAPESLRS